MQSLLALLICVFSKKRHLNNKEPEPLGKSISFSLFSLYLVSAQDSLNVFLIEKEKQEDSNSVLFDGGYFLNECVCVCLCVCTSLGSSGGTVVPVLSSRSCFSGREWRQLCLQLKSWHTFTRIYYSYHSVSGRDLRPPVYLTNSPLFVSFLFIANYVHILMN